MNDLENFRSCKCNRGTIVRKSKFLYILQNSINIPSSSFDSFDLILSICRLPSKPTDLCSIVKPEIVIKNRIYYIYLRLFFYVLLKSTYNG